ncbi:MAG: hypothetical protein ACRDRH_28060, partial [Pseudonocardia sp.]
PGATSAWPDMIAAHQVAALQALWPGAEWAVLDVTRGLFLAVSLLGCLLLWPVARRFGLSMPAAAAVVLLCGLPAPLAVLHAPVGAGLAAVWLTLAVAAVGRGRAGTAVAVVAAGVGVLTVPPAAAAVLAGTAAAALFPARRRRGGVTLGTAMVGGAVLVAVLSTGGPAWTVSGGTAVPTSVLAGALVVGALVAGSAWRHRELRPGAAAVCALLVCAGLPSDHRLTVLLLVAPVLVLLAAAQLSELVGRVRDRRVPVASVTPPVLTTAGTVPDGVPSAQPITAAATPDLAPAEPLVTAAAGTAPEHPTRLGS